MPRILVSYRRDDSAAYAGRLADRLKKQFGRDHVFVDIDNIRPGEDFVERIDQSIPACDVLVAVIGKSWLMASDAQGNRRLEREDDFVRMEIAKALECHRRVIPALVGDATMPTASQLPQDLVALCRRQAIEISDSRFHQDVDELIKALADAPGVSSHPEAVRQPRREQGWDILRAPQKRRWIIAAAIAALLLVGYWFWRARNTPSNQGTDVPSSTNAPGAESSPTSGSSSPTSAPAPSAGNGELSAPAIAPQPAGKTGIQVVWRGSTRVPCYLFDETGTKALSPNNGFEDWHCSRDMGLWDAAPGKYQIKFGGVADTMPPHPIRVARGEVLRVEPHVGQLRLHWNGSNRIHWYLLDPTGQKTLSPEPVYVAWACESGEVCTQDLGPGSYMIKVDAAGYQPVKATVTTFRITDVTIP